MILVLSPTSYRTEIAHLGLPSRLMQTFGSAVYAHLHDSFPFPSAEITEAEFDQLYPQFSNIEIGQLNLCPVYDRGQLRFLDGQRRLFVDPLRVGDVVHFFTGEVRLVRQCDPFDRFESTHYVCLGFRHLQVPLFPLELVKKDEKVEWDYLMKKILQVNPAEPSSTLLSPA